MSFSTAAKRTCNQGSAAAGVAVTGGQQTVATMTEIVNEVLDNPIFPAIGLGLAGTIGALWVAGAWWAYRDATWRTGSWFLGMLAAGWIILSTPLLLPLSLGVYALTRPQHTAAEGRSRRLVEELMTRLEAASPGTCPACESAIDREWLRCPMCATWLAEPCAHCGGWSDRILAVCPWCGSEERAEPAVESLAPERVPIGEAFRKRRRRQSRRQPFGVVAFDARQPRGRLEALLDGVRPPARAGS
jgi:hypothetical protein